MSADQCPECRYFGGYHAYTCERARTEEQQERAEQARDAQTVTIGQLVRMAADMIGTIPNDELGDDPAVSVCNAVSELVRRAAGLPDERQSEIDDAIAWANS